jgi:hypothetical protein
MLEDTLTKPGTALAWTGIGVATGGATRALAPGMEAAVAASRVPGAALGTRALGTGIRAAPYVMGGLFAGQVGFETGFESTPTGLKVRSPGGMVSRLGGLTATEIVPMIGGGIIGYNAPEIGQAAYRGVRAGELRFRRFGEGLGEEGLLGPGEMRPEKGTPQEYQFREKPAIDLTNLPEEAIVLNEPRNVVATGMERRMIIEQYGLTEKEISYLKETGTSLNDLLGLRQQFRSPKPEIMIIPEEGLPDLRTDWDIFPVTKTQSLLKPQQLERLFTLQEAKQVSDLQYLGMQGTLLKPGQKVMVDAKLTNLSMGGVKPLSMEDISIALGTSTLLKPLTQQVVSTKQQQKQDQILIGLFSGVGLADLQAQTQEPISIQGSRVMPFSLNLQNVGLQQVTLQEPVLDLGLRTQVIQVPDLQIPPITTVIQVPDLQIPPITTVIQVPDLQIPPITTTILTPEIDIPPYTPPPGFTFEIPPIPPIIIPGFPMGLGGGGGGGGYGGDRGGYQFEETLTGGGDSDPFGIGGMNFDVMGMMGIPKGTVGKGRRRRRK